MAGLYLHIPFCKQACVYCDFHFSTQQDQLPKMIAAIKREMHLRRDFIQEETLDSIYFGGGTPSLAGASAIKELLAEAGRIFAWSEEPEITLEANPDDLNATHLYALRDAGINRLSIGLQSFREEDLRFMNRAHTAEQSHKVVSRAHQAGFHDLTVDLIYGLPHQDLADWQAQLQELAALDLPHFSAYSLTVEPRTVLAHQVKKGRVQLPDEDIILAQFRALQDFAAGEGYQHYELSNFAKAGREAKHNSAYWQGRPYLGLGPSAHSYRPGERQWNVANNALYLKALAEDQLPLEGEQLGIAERYNEKVMTALRLQNGLDLALLEQELGSSWRRYLLREARKDIEEGRLEQAGEMLYIPTAWRFQSDGIAANLFYTEA